MFNSIRKFYRGTKLVRYFNGSFCATEKNCKQLRLLSPAKSVDMYCSFIDYVISST
jgi:hypothetical protein